MKYITAEIKMLTELFNRNGYEIFLVGGCVRDMLMDIPPSDFDLATSALPNQTKEVLKDFRTIDTGLKHGTVTAIIADTPYEITTYRIDRGYSDSRHPDRVDFTGKLSEDMARRDFTINAMAMDSEGNVIDRYGGREDIEKKIIRAVGNPDRRFSEDALRILRALRFSARLGFDIEEKTAKALVRNSKLLENISAERIFSEISKTLVCEFAPQVVLQFSDVFSRTIFGGQCDKAGHLSCFADFLQETYLCAEGAEIRFAALFEILDVENPKEVLKRLKVSNAFLSETTGILTCVKEFSDWEKTTDDAAIEKNLRLMLIDHPEEHVRKALLIKAFCEKNAINEKAKDLAESVLRIKASGCFDMRCLAICGNDLKAMGIEGRDIGAWLRKVLREVAKGSLENEKEKIKAYIKSALKNES